MRLFTRTLLQGLHDGLVEHGGMPPFPNDKIASAIFDEIATDAGLPPYLERRLDKTAAVTLSRAIAAYSEKLAGAGMVAPPARVALVKQASQRDLGERAMVVAGYYMQKAAARRPPYEAMRRTSRPPPAPFPTKPGSSCTRLR